ncbi:membrane-associated protein, putative, partial [Bodo saltans]
MSQPVVALLPPRRRFHGLCVVTLVAVLIMLLVGLWVGGFSSPSLLSSSSLPTLEVVAVPNPSCTMTDASSSTADDTCDRPSLPQSAMPSSATTLHSMLSTCRSEFARKNKRNLGGHSERSKSPYYHFPVDDASLVCVASGDPIHSFYRAPLSVVSGGSGGSDNAAVPEHMSQGTARFERLSREEDLERALTRPFRSRRSFDHHHNEDNSNSGDDIVGKRRRALRFHGSHQAVMLMGTWNSVNWYHLLMDYLLGLAHWDLTHLKPTTMDDQQQQAQSSINGADRRVVVPARTIVHIVNSSWNRQWGKYDQRACMDYSSAFGSDPVNTPSVVIRTTQPNAHPQGEEGKRSHSDSDDDALHCFCGAMFVGGHVLPRGEPSVNFESSSRSAALRHYRNRMVMKYNELPFGEVPRVEHYTRLGFWAANNNTTSMPRLLLVNRNRRRIGNFDKIEAMAKEIGFNVATVYFENMAPHAQFHLSRYADVLVGIHGMALTFVANMDGDLGARKKPSSHSSTVHPTSSCKT